MRTITISNDIVDIWFDDIGDVVKGLDLKNVKFGIFKNQGLYELHVSDNDFASLLLVLPEGSITKVTDSDTISLFVSTEYFLSRRKMGLDKDVDIRAVLIILLEMLYG